MVSNQHKQYIRDEIKSATPQKLILLLYDGAIKNLEDSKLYIEKEDQFDFTQSIAKAEQIIAELIGALKSNTAPELVANLSRLYEFMYQNLVNAHLERSVEKIDQVISLMRGLRESWAEAVEKMEQDPEGHPMPSVEEQPKERPSFTLEA